MSEGKDIALVWQEKGYLDFSFFDEYHVDIIKEELNRLRINRNSKDNSWGEYDMYSHPHKESEIILSLFGTPRILEILEYLMGDKVEGVQSLAYFKPPGELGRDMHQDAFYSDSEWNKTINVIISLDDADESNGCLWSFEGSHNLPILPIAVDEERAKTNTAFWQNERGKACVMPENHNYPKIYHLCRAGDIVMMHSHLVHGSGDNNSNNYRNSLVLGYKAKNTKIREGFKMKREPFDVYNVYKYER